MGVGGWGAGVSPYAIPDVIEGGYPLVEMYEADGEEPKQGHHRKV